MNAIAYVHEQLTGKKDIHDFKPGDNITVNYKIIEGNKERIQSFKGDVIKRQGTGATATFTVRKISDGVGVERLFPFFSPQTSSRLSLTKPAVFAVQNYTISANAVVRAQGSRKSAMQLRASLQSDLIRRGCSLLLYFG